MYGVPDYPDLDMNEVMTQADVDLMMAAAVENSTTASGSEGALNSSTPSSASPGQEPCAVVSMAIAALPSGARPVVPA